MLTNVGFVFCTSHAGRVLCERLQRALKSLAVASETLEQVLSSLPGKNVLCTCTITLYLLIK